jgi:hypothetical protein
MLGLRLESPIRAAQPLFPGPGILLSFPSRAARLGREDVNSADTRDAKSDPSDLDTLTAHSHRLGVLDALAV